VQTLSSDTSSTVEQVQISLLRRNSSWQKLNAVQDLNTTVQTLAMSGLRRRHKDDSDVVLRRRLAELLLGHDLVSKVYGPHLIDVRRFREDRSMTTAIEVTLLVIEQLDALGIRYMVGGSFASSIHGVPRSTNDADIVADLRPEHVGTLTRALSSQFYIEASSIHDAIQHRGSFNVIYLEQGFKVDIFLPKSREFDNVQLSRRVLEMFSHDPDRYAYVASAEDSVLAKLEWYRKGNEVSDRQFNDILGILKVRAADTDLAYLRHWAPIIGVADLLERALNDAGLQ